MVFLEIPGVESASGEWHLPNYCFFLLRFTAIMSRSVPFPSGWELNPILKG